MKKFFYSYFEYLFDILCDERWGGGGLVSPIGGQNAFSFVITRQTMDTALNQNQPKLWVLILSVALQMLSDGHRLLNQMVEVFGQSRCQTLLLKDSEDLISGNPSDLSHSVPVSKHYTNLWGSHTLLRQFANLFHDIIGSQFKPLLQRKGIH